FVQLDAVAASALKAGPCNHVKACGMFLHRSLQNPRLFRRRFELYNKGSIHVKCISYIPKFVNRQEILPLLLPQTRNAYLLTFGGFLLLGGRLGDLFGHRRLFLIGITLFTLASLACGMARAQGFLVTARAIQGLGGAVVSAVALSLIMNLFTEPAERAKAMGFFGFVAAGGGSIGVLLGGVLTNALNWHWVFLVNLPVGVAVVALS